MAATRVPLTDVVGLFLCRRARPSFSNAALVGLMDEFRTIVCRCGTQFDVQILTAEKLSPDTADLLRSGHCPACRRAHASHLQFQRNGLILTREGSQWFVWLSKVTPNRLGDAIEEHLFWYQVDWSKGNEQLADELSVPDDMVRSWRRKVARTKAPAGTKSGANRRVRMPRSRRGSSASA